jgi:hypothetical protein
MSCIRNVSLHLVAAASIFYSVAANANDHQADFLSSFGVTSFEPVNDQMWYGTEGCPAGSVLTQVDPQGLQMQAQFNNFGVSAGFGGTPNQEKTCRLRAQVNIPRNWQIGVSMIATRGHLNAQNGAVYARLVSSFQWDTDRLATTVFDRGFSGPYNNRLTMAESLPSHGVRYSSCSSFDRTALLDFHMLHAAVGNNFGTVSWGLDPWAQQSIAYEYRLVARSCNPDILPPSNQFRAQCRSTLENSFGGILGEYFGVGLADSRTAALRSARFDAQNQCDRSRAGNQSLQCFVRVNECTVSP